MIPNILVLLEDAMRRDAFYQHPSMAAVHEALRPYVDYPNWYAVGNCTYPNMASMLTGQYPWEHGLRHMASSLAARTLIDDFRDMGYTTIYAGRYIDWVADSCSLRWTYYSGPIAKNRGPTSEQARRLIREARKPWFALVRHMWCHAKYVDGDYTRSVEATADDLLGLIAWIRMHFPYTIVIATADHGEMIRVEQHCIDSDDIPIGHAWGLYEPLVHVPMIVSDPSCSNRINPGWYQHVDFMDILMGHTPSSRKFLPMEAVGVDARWRRYHRGVIRTPDGAKLIVGGLANGTWETLLYLGLNESIEVSRRYPEVCKDLSKYLPPPLVKSPKDTEWAVVLDRLRGFGYV